MFHFRSNKHTRIKSALRLYDSRWSLFTPIEVSEETLPFPYWANIQWEIHGFTQEKILSWFTLALLHIPQS